MPEESIEQAYKPISFYKTGGGRGAIEQLGFVAEMAIERLKKPDWRREEKENRARRNLLKYIIIDRKREPLSPETITEFTKPKRRRVDRILGEEESVMIGSEASHSLIFQKSGERYVAAHFYQGSLQTLAAINLSENVPYKTRVIFNNTNEGRIESSQEPGYELTHTTVHAFNFLVERAGRKPILRKRQPPQELQEQIEKELTPPKKLLLREELFHQINEAAGRPLENGGVFIITDTSLGSPLGTPESIEGLRRGGLPRLSEIDDFMQILLCRGDKGLAEKVKAFGQTSRGNASTRATLLAVSIGQTERKPVFPGYNPYLQAYETSDPIRISPTALAILELGKAKAVGKEVTLVDEAPTTERLYATAIKLAQERGIDISHIPAIFMVGVKVNDAGEAELIESPLNFNYCLAEDCRRGFQLALEHFEDITLFSGEMATVGIPIADFEKLSEFMAKTGRAENQRVAETFMLRAKSFSAFRRVFEAGFSKQFGKPVKFPEGHFLAQDTLIGAYLAHPEWFVVKEMLLKYRSATDGSERRKNTVRVITDLTPEGKDQFRPWLWLAIKANFKAKEEKEKETLSGLRVLKVLYTQMLRAIREKNRRGEQYTPSFVRDFETVLEKTRPIVEGEENLPQEGGYLITMNHYHEKGITGGWSVPVAMVALGQKVLERTGKEPRWLIGTPNALSFLPPEYIPEKTPLIVPKWIYDKYGYGFIRVGLRPEDRIASVREMLKAIRGKDIVALCPEMWGSIQLRKAYEGVGFTASKTGCPVIPVGLWVDKERRVHVKVGSPIQTTNLDRRQATGETMEAIARLLPGGLEGFYKQE